MNCVDKEGSWHRTSIILLGPAGRQNFQLGFRLIMANKASISARAPAAIVEERMEAAEQGGPVLVTGAARRIGLSLAEGFARAGRPVVLHASPRSQAAASSAAAALVAQGFRARALACDLASATEACDLIPRAEEPFGPLTLLVNNSALFEPDSAQDF